MVLLCPRCSRPLSPARIGRLILQACRVCHGRMMSMGVLRDLIDKAAVDRMWRALNGTRAAVL